MVASVQTASVTPDDMQTCMRLSRLRASAIYPKANIPNRYQNYPCSISVPPRLSAWASESTLPRASWQTFWRHISPTSHWTTLVQFPLLGALVGNDAALWLHNGQLAWIQKLNKTGSFYLPLRQIGLTKLEGVPPVACTFHNQTPPRCPKSWRMQPLGECASDRT